MSSSAIPSENRINSQLMTGSVRHRRFTPKQHNLNYDLFMPCLDIDEIPSLSKKVWGFGTHWWHWARFKREDYVGEGCLKAAVQQKVAELTGVELDGRVLAVCHLRYLGLYFSPVNFYYLFDKHGQWQYLLAEVSNTPWNERHYYAIPADSGLNGENWQHEKAFHVSPFNPVEQDYVWKLKYAQQRIMVHLECHRQNKEFDATLSLKGSPFDSTNLLKHLIKTPLMTVKVVIGIYWHALKLFLKKVPIYNHPNKKLK
jgi:DUF1365 family protein